MAVAPSSDWQPVSIQVRAERPQQPVRAAQAVRRDLGGRAGQRQPLAVEARATRLRAEPRYTTSRYFALPAEGVLTAEDRVELFEGLIVAMAMGVLPRKSFSPALTGEPRG